MILRLIFQKGVHSLKKKFKEYSDDQLKLMQSQDLKYVKYKHQMEKKKIDRIQSSSHLIDSEYRPAKSHIFFVDSKKQGERFNCLLSYFSCFFQWKNSIQ